MKQPTKKPKPERRELLINVEDCAEILQAIGALARKNGFTTVRIQIYADSPGAKKAWKELKAEVKKMEKPK